MANICYFYVHMLIFASTNNNKYKTMTTNTTTNTDSSLVFKEWTALNAELVALDLIANLGRKILKTNNQQ